MSDSAFVIAEAVDRACRDLCKFSYGEGEKKCIWRETHEGECPLDKILEEIGVK